jgi:hypothetical protein
LISARETAGTGKGHWPRWQGLPQCFSLEFCFGDSRKKVGGPNLPHPSAGQLRGMLGTILGIRGNPKTLVSTGLALSTKALKKQFRIETKRKKWKEQWALMLRRILVAWAAEYRDRCVGELAAGSLVLVPAGRAILAVSAVA